MSKCCSENVSCIIYMYYLLMFKKIADSIFETIRTTVFKLWVLYQIRRRNNNPLYKVIFINAIKSAQIIKIIKLTSSIFFYTF